MELAVYFSITIALIALFIGIARVVYLMVQEDFVAPRREKEEAELRLVETKRRWRERELI